MSGQVGNTENRFSRIVGYMYIKTAHESRMQLTGVGIRIVHAFFPLSRPSPPYTYEVGDVSQPDMMNRAFKVPN